MMKSIPAVIFNGMVFWYLVPAQRLQDQDCRSLVKWLVIIATLGGEDT
jgi:hypothetical protein